MKQSSQKQHAKTKKDEKMHLSLVVDKLHAAKDKLHKRIDEYDKEILKDKDYIWENRADMDGAEKASNRMFINQSIDSGEEAITSSKRIKKLIDSPYFGRVDFKFGDYESDDIEPLYIGLHSFSENPGDPLLIYDWRAPISTLFYDFEKGKAQYEAPTGQIDGEIILKRQYKIRDSKMEYMIESDVNIGDEVLQKELSTTSNNKMKNIVVTIQRQQNEIIRNSSARTLIVQGVAGSGKTSIALHRVAFLLYRYKGNLTSKNIVIISPNKVFADFISNVLPELGEENIGEIGIEQIANAILGGQYKFKTFGEQVSNLIHKQDSDEVKRIEYKSSVDFANKLTEFLENCACEFFEATDIQVESFSISKDEIVDNFNINKFLTIEERIEKTANDTVARAKSNSEKTMPAAVARKIKKQIVKMYKYSNPLDLYKAFFSNNGLKSLFVHKKGQLINYDDLFGLCMTSLYWKKFDSFNEIKHLLIDEMQDYTPIQYAVLFKLFKCKKTIMGDINQSVNPYSSSSLEKIKTLAEDSECVEMLTSYRCSFEITKFSQNISGNLKIIPVERHGENPQIVKAANDKEHFSLVKKDVKKFINSENSTCGIICKTQNQANMIFNHIKNLSEEIYLLDASSNEYKQGIIVTSAHMSKGLEFDYVIIPYANEENYKNELDKNLLYIACTRAMHVLNLFYHGEKSSLLPEATV